MNIENEDFLCDQQHSNGNDKKKPTEQEITETARTIFLGKLRKKLRRGKPGRMPPF